MAKVKKYTETILIRLDKKNKTSLDQKCVDLEMNEAVYCRKAVELCLRKNLIDGKGQS